MLNSGNAENMIMLALFNAQGENIILDIIKDRNAVFIRKESEFKMTPSIQKNWQLLLLYSQ